MYQRILAVSMALVFALSGSIVAAEKKGEGKKDEAAKPEEKKDGAQNLPGKKGSWHGRLYKGKYGSLASLRTMPEKKKKDKSFKSETLYLWAEGDLAKKLFELRKEGATVNVSGLLAPDGKNVKVESLEDKTKRKKKKK